MNNEQMGNERTKEEPTMNEAEQLSISDESKKIPREAITGILIDKLLDCLRSGYFSDFFEKNEKWLTKTGLLSLYISALLGLLSSVVLPLRYDLHFWTCFGVGIVWFFSCIVIHYTAWKFLPVLSHIIQTTPTKLSSKAFLDSLALIAGITGIISILGGLFLWIKTSSFETFIAGIFIFIFCEYILSLCLNPKNLNIEISEQTSVGEEFLGLISFFMKGFLKLVPIIFGSGIIFGIINLLELLFMKFEYMGQILTKTSEVGNLTAVSLLPVTSYCLFLAYYFVIDLAMAILAVPVKLDRLDKQK